MKNEEPVKIERGRPKQPETVKPSLRIQKTLWLEFKKMYPGMVNRMFIEFVTKKIQKK